MKGEDLRGLDPLGDRNAEKNNKISTLECLFEKNFTLASLGLTLNTCRGEGGCFGYCSLKVLSGYVCLMIPTHCGGYRDVSKSSKAPMESVFF